MARCSSLMACSFSAAGRVISASSAVIPSWTVDTAFPTFAAISRIGNPSMCIWRARARQSFRTAVFAVLRLEPAMFGLLCVRPALSQRGPLQFVPHAQLDRIWHGA